MADVRIAPDLVGSLRLDQLERNGVHRRNRGKLDESLGFGVTELRRHAGESFEACGEEPRRSFATGFLDHGRIFAAASDGPPEHRCQAGDVSLGVVPNEVVQSRGRGLVAEAAVSSSVVVSLEVGAERLGAFV